MGQVIFLFVIAIVLIVFIIRSDLKELKAEEKRRKTLSPEELEAEIEKSNLRTKYFTHGPYGGGGI